MPQCKECNTQFTVHPNDKKILEYFDAPEPTLCATHSLQQRLSWRNERHLYKRTCELCGKDILAMYSKNSYAHVYCRDCWYSDNWDSMSYGRDYDPSQSFFEQFAELLGNTPLSNLFQIGSVNSDYCNVIYNSKDSYLSFSNVRSEGSLYSKIIDDSRDCTDSYIIKNSELLFECVHVNDSYFCAYLTRCEKCSECYLSRDLQDCQNCFGCVNMHHKQYCWFNEQLTKDEYERRLALALKDRSSFEEQQKKFEIFSKDHPFEFATIRNCDDVTGDFLGNCKEIRRSFFTYDAENCGDCFRLIWNSKDNYRASFGGTAIGCYNCQPNPFSTSSMCVFGNEHCSFASYSFYCLNSDSIFGCVGLRKKKFCILNKQYDQLEYEELKTKIIEDMKKRGEYGEFMPNNYLPHGYNDGVGHEYFPLSRDEVLARGWPWEDEQGGSRGKETHSSKDIPASIDEVDEAIIKDIFACSDCGLNYRIIKQEFERLKKFHFAIPVKCPDCRFKKRFERSIVPVLYHRSCMCVENHPAHQGAPCDTTLETTYAQERPEIVYCNACYREVLQ
ncbi:hypothetical protein HY620_01630 [Candidatus Uhrbacteria bacterium]|nr:hypothetical protein [Candidatus Uhrbacteria bacterium]